MLDDQEKKLLNLFVDFWPVRNAYNPDCKQPTMRTSEAYARYIERMELERLIDISLKRIEEGFRSYYELPKEQ